MDSGFNSMQKQFKTVQNPVNVLLASIITFTLMLFGIAGQITYAVIKSEVIYKGIEINGINVGNISREEAKILLDETYGTLQISGGLTVNIDDYSKAITYDELGVFYDVDRYIEKAYSIGRNGDIVRRLYDSLVTARYGKSITMKPIYNKQKLMKFIEEIYEDTHVIRCDPYITVTDKYVNLYSGCDGRKIERENAYNTLEPIVLIHKDAFIELPVLQEKRVSLDAEDIYREIIKEPINASAKVKNNTVIITPHKEGKNIDKVKLAQAVEELTEEYVEKIIPFKFIEPDITAEEVREKIFKDNLSTASTKFDISTENGKNRSINIELATSKIDGKIVAPGEVFSFNNIVGPREEKYGYQAAHVYINGEVTDGIGGGICQVSSTLYNAVLHAGL